MSTNGVVHFEMPFDDRDRAAAFYEKAFGWQANKLGAEMGNYCVERTGPVDQKNWPTEVGRINGGLYDRSMSKTNHGTNVVIGTDDLKAALARVKENGGTVLSEPMMIPGQGEYAMIKDTEGNVVGIIQPMPM